MAFEDTAYTPTIGLKDANTYPTTPANEAAARKQIQDVFDQIRDEVNTKVIAVLNSTTDSASGADNVGATAITDLDGATVQEILESIRNKLKSVTDSSSGADFVGATAISGLTGGTVQALLEALKTFVDIHKTSTDHDSRYYTETEIDAKISSTNGAIASVDGVTNATGNIDLIGGTGITVTPNNTAKTITITATGEAVPAAHADTHETGGIDELTPDGIGATSITDFNTHLADIVTHGFDNIIAFAGFYKVTKEDFPSAGDITDTIYKSSDDSVFATRVTEFDTPTAGDITVTVFCTSLSINNKVVTEFDTPASGDITETSSEVI